MNETSKFQIRPLYLQVRDALVERIKDGRWKPGATLPSEIDLYRELGVSLGTLRKALGILESERLVVREPGRGTFVRQHQAGRTVSRLNPWRGADGAPIQGQIKTRGVKLSPARGWERTALGLEPDEQIVRVQRVRFHGQRPFAYEILCLPDRRFPGLAQRNDVSDEIEELAQAWGVLVVRAEAKLKLMPPSPAAAAALALNKRASVLCLERLSFDTDDRPIEAMTAYCDAQDEYCSLDMR